MIAGAPRRRGLLALGLLTALAALTAAGCQYLLGFDPSDPSFTDDFANPSPLATYGMGTASVTIGDDSPIELDRLAAHGALFKSFGGEATFRNADGWYLKVSGASTASASILGAGGFVQLDRVKDAQHWTTADPTRCIVTMDTADATGLKGRADCKGLRWSDALATGFSNYEPAYIEGEDPFDAVMTFEASPGTGQSG